MKYIKYLLLISLTLLHIENYAQIVISATSTEGCGTLTTTFNQTNTLSTVTSILWRFGDGGIDNSNTSSPTYTYTKPGVYNVTVILNGTDSLVSSKLINVFVVPNVGIEYNLDSLNADPLVVSMKAVVYNDDQVKYKQYTYFWEIDGDIEGTNSTASHTFDSIGTYNASLIITTVKGCKDTTTKTIELFQKINVPNVITPNGDGYNDNLVIENNDKYYLNLQLFNRAGLLVYKIKAKTIQWDGKLHTGEDVPEGIYYYILEAEKSSPPLKMKGFLYIFR